MLEDIDIKEDVMMLSDIEISKRANMLHIRDVAKKLGIGEDDLEYYGKYKAKLSSELQQKITKNKETISISFLFYSKFGLYND